jgi:UDP-N-acetylglucosamine--N-acetylmuramyl-(pentapeptide) pyrophosphoryl-undecaprenol N-acetylglucosamine transferase
MRVLLAAGKTGGHIFPALALAEEFMRRDSQSKILLVGSQEAIAGQILEQQDINWQGIEARPLKGRGPMGKLQAVLALTAGLRQARGILRRFQPQVVIGTGGYSSAPLVIAAVLGRIPCFLQEQNLLPGLTNRWLGRLVKKIFTSFAESARFFPPGRTISAGNPVRSQTAEVEADYKVFGLEPGRFTVLVFGGSQGAHRLNLTMLDAVKCWPAAKLVCQVIHQTGERDYHLVQEAYQKRRISAYVTPFIEQMATAYALADLVVCRAGATTMAELMLSGKPSILVPYPYAANDHQTINARYLADREAALIIPEAQLDGQRLAAEISALQRDSARREKMGRQARRLAKPEAAQTIVSYLLGYRPDWEQKVPSPLGGRARVRGE